MKRETPIPVFCSEQGRMIQAIDDAQAHRAAVVQRLDAPTHRQAHAAGRIVQDLLERGAERSNSLDDSSGSEHGAALATVARAGRRPCANAVLR